MCNCVYIYEYTYSNIVYVYVCARVTMCSYIYMREVIGNSMYTYIYKKNIYAHGRACNNNMYAWGCGGKYNNMRIDALLTRDRSVEKKKRKREICA